MVRCRVGLLGVGAIGAALAVGCGEAAAPSVAEMPSNAAPAPPPAAPAQGAEPASVADLFPEGPGRELVLNNCSSCHAVACSAIGQRTAARWDSLKEDHRDKAASLGQQELDTIFAYLKSHFDDSQPEPRVPAEFLEGGCTPF